MKGILRAMSMQRLSILTVAVATLCSAISIAGGAESGGGELGSAVKFALSPMGREKLASARLGVVLFSGVESLRTRAMEDAVALELMNTGMEVVSRPRVETLLAEKLAETIPVAPGKEGSDQKPDPSVRPLEPVGVVQIAKAAGAQFALIGTMLDERQRSALVSTGKPGQLLEQPLVVVTVSIQVVDVESNSLLMVLLGHWPNGTSIPEAAQELASTLKARAGR